MRSLNRGNCSSKAPSRCNPLPPFLAPESTNLLLLLLLFLCLVQQQPSGDAIKMQREVRVLKKKITDLEALVQKLQSGGGGGAGEGDNSAAQLKKNLEEVTAQLAQSQAQVILILAPNHFPRHHTSRQLTSEQPPIRKPRLKRTFRRNWLPWSNLWS